MAPAFFRYTALSLILTTAIGCANKAKEASLENFQAILTGHIGQQSACLPFQNRIAFPLEMPLQNIEMHKPEDYDPYVEAGILDAEDIILPPSDVPPRRYTDTPGRRYTLTQVGQDLYEVQGGHPCMRYGRIEPQAISFNEPNESLGETVTTLRYIAHLRDVEPWAEHPAIKHLYHQRLLTSKPPQERSLALIMTKKGWAVR